MERRAFNTASVAGMPDEPSTSDFALVELGSERVFWTGFFQGQDDFAVVVPGSSMRGLFDVPFDIRPGVALGSDGFYLTLGEDQGPEILEYDAFGRLRRVIRLAEPAVAPSSEDLDRFIRFRIESSGVSVENRESTFDRRRPMYEQMPLPEIIPVFSRLLIDEVGWLWAQLYRFDGRHPMRWLVFGPNGEGLGSVDMPTELDVRQIGPDFVLGVWEDEHEVQYVRRHALTGRLVS